MDYCMLNGNYQQIHTFTPNNMEFVPNHQAYRGHEFINDKMVNTYENSMVVGSASPCHSMTAPSVELMQINGRKVLGPPEDWVGPPPTSVCELFVRRIPKDLNENKLLSPFLRFGRIYEIRLPMDFNQANRGYAYVKYTTEEEAACAMEVLNHYYVSAGRKLEILHSYEKCRLFVSNIPKHLEEYEIEEKLRTIFPFLQRIYTRPSSSTNNGEVVRDACGDCNQESGISSTVGCGNRGHVFVHFPSHMHALEAKKSITPGLIRMWDRDLKVVWANTERDSDMSKSSKTLFVRNVDLTVNKRDVMDLLVKHVPRTTIRHISKVRTTAFVDFTTREAAELCLKQLQGVVLRERYLDLEWAKPSEQQSLHRMRNTDFDAVLRLKCIANGWHIPIIIFGCYFENERLQYGVVVLRDALGNVRATLCILNASELVDIHSRMCEVVCVLIESIGGFPNYNYVFLVEKDTAHLLGMVTQNLHNVDFMAACGVPNDIYFDLNEIVDLSWAVTSLTYTSEESLLKAYKESFRTHDDCTYLKNWPLVPHRIFGTIMPKYRNKPPLKYNLNDTQIVLALCFKTSGTNSALPTRPYLAFPACGFKQVFEGLRYVSLKLLPVALTQSRFVVSHILSHVQFGGSQYYHPDQRIMLPPLWISGCSYTESIKQPQAYLNALSTMPESTEQMQTYTAVANLQPMQQATFNKSPTQCYPQPSVNYYMAPQQTQPQPHFMTQVLTSTTSPSSSMDGSWCWTPREKLQMVYFVVTLISLATLVFVQISEQKLR